ncbi:LOW QUALITY PROTEIN: hypothetical protein SSRG_01673, partial [Streptomyces griseoflavus Tu4000]
WPPLRRRRSLPRRGRAPAYFVLSGAGRTTPRPRSVPDCSA